MFLPIVDKIDVRNLENIFMSMTNSYKIFWFNSIFEEVIQGNQVIDFRSIVCNMIASAWYPLITYHLNFGSQDQLEKAVIEINQNYIGDNSINKNDLFNKLIVCENKEVNKNIELFYRYVPYRLLTPFYEQALSGKKDGEKNKIIENLSMKDFNGLYRVSSKEKSIFINDNWFEYIFKNQNIIRGWINYKLIEFLQSRNPTVPGIIYKLSPPLERNLKAATQYWNTVLKAESINDIYTGVAFNEINFDTYGNLSIDHFIPWSFITHDEKWNLIPTFKNVNSSKSDKLPDLNKYLEAFCEMQFRGVDIIRKTKNGAKQLEDYLSIDSKLDISSICSVRGELNKDKFIRDLKNTINPVYQLAYNNGFGQWSYDNYLYNKDIMI